MHKKSRRVNKRQKRQKCRSRKHGRLRMKGGLNIHNLQEIEIDSSYLNMRKRYSLLNPKFIPYFKLYVFGSETQRVAWETLLNNCQSKGVPVFILSAGNKIGIIRMLQLMGLDDKFEEVLCTNGNVLVNPLTRGTHNFQGYTKYNVIRTILRERGLPLVAIGPPIGCLMDDDPRNDDTTVPNKTIQFVNVNSVEQPQTPDQIGNMFYNLVASNLSLQPLIKRRAFADVNVINQVASLVDQGHIKILFIDFDQTLGQYSGALPFHDSNFTMAFHSSFPITTTGSW